MNTRALLSFLLLGVAASFSAAQMSAPMRNYNVTSPVPNGPYVVDRILPCTYRLLRDVDSSSLHLQIILQPVSVTAPATSSAGNQHAAASPAPASAVASPTASGGGSLASNSSSSAGNATQPQPIVITDNADVSKTEASAKHDGNATTYFEHSFNFKIPSTVAPGRYNVVFRDVSTNTELPIPIEIRSAAPSSSPNGGPGGKTLGGSSNGTSNDGHSQSIFASGAPSSCMPASILLLSSLVMFAFAI